MIFNVLTYNCTKESLSLPSRVYNTNTFFSELDDNQYIRMYPLIFNYQSSILTWTFTFSAKEKDTETGFSYFGSRYYSSDLSIWLSVDPQASKYPHQSNYVYCSNNPIKVIDPNGEDEWDLA